MIKYYKHTLIDLFTKIHAIQALPMKSLEQCQAVQYILIQRVTYIEKRIQQCKVEIADFKRQLTIRQTKDKAQEIKQAISYRYQLIDEYKNILYIFKSVGDALAFIYISPWDIKPMNFKEPAGFISGKRGLREERRILKFLFDKKRIAILNDLTNSLRYGDITLVLEEGIFTLIEVKSGKQRDKNHAVQLGKMQKITTYLETDKVDDLYREGEQIVRISMHSEEKHHRDKLNELISQALKSGFAFAETEKGLAYIVDATESLDQVKACFQAIGTIQASPIVFMLNSAKYLNCGYYPFVLTIQNSNAAFAFWAGEIIITIAIDLKVIENKLAHHNLYLEFLDEPEWRLKITDSNYSGAQATGKG